MVSHETGGFCWATCTFFYNIKTLKECNNQQKEYNKTNSQSDNND